MTVLIPEAAGALEAGGAAEGAGAAGAGDATVFSKTTQVPKAAPPAKTAPAPRAKAAPKPKKAAAPNVPMSLRRSKTSQVYGKRAGKATPYDMGKSRARQGAAFFKPPNLLPGGGGVAHKLVIAEFAACVIMIGADPVLTRKPADSHLYLANDFIRLTAVCGLFFVLALAANTEKMAKVSAAFGALVTLGILFNAAPAFSAVSTIFTGAAATNKAGGKVEAASAGTATVDRATYTPVDLMGDPSASAQRSQGTSVSTATGDTTTGSGVISV